MITYQVINLQHIHKLQEIDRSETIDLIYEMGSEKLAEIPASHECPAWDPQELKEIQERYVFELEKGGMAVGAFDENTLVGFGVLAHKWRGPDQNQLQVDLMYVSRNQRRKGIGSEIIRLLSDEARKRGAAYLYISSTETRSAVSFYKSKGSYITKTVDEELYKKEPKDIHMLIKL